MKSASSSPRAASSCVHPRGILVLGVCQVNYQNCHKTKSNLNRKSNKTTKKYKQIKVKSPGQLPEAKNKSKTEEKNILISASSLQCPHFDLSHLICHILICHISICHILILISASTMPACLPHWARLLWSHSTTELESWVRTNCVIIHNAI